MRRSKLAVSHYLEHGQCLAYTIRTLGYPTRKTLNGRIAELWPEFRKNVVGGSCSVPRSLPEQLQAVIALQTRKGAGREVAAGARIIDGRMDESYARDKADAIDPRRIVRRTIIPQGVL